VLDAAREALVATMAEVAARDASIARVLREICALDGAVRSGALDLVGAHLAAQAAARDVLDCVEALRRDEVARRLGELLGGVGAGAPRGDAPAR
jgi:hypothetical protein